MWGQSLGWEGLLEQGMATHSSIPAWRIPWTEEPGGLQSTGLQSQTRLKLLRTHAMAPHEGTEGECYPGWKFRGKIRSNSMCSPCSVNIPLLCPSQQRGSRGCSAQFSVCGVRVYDCQAL